MSTRNSRYRILVSDREKNTRDAVTEIFTEAGYSVDAAGSGSETIEMLTRQSYDLIFCDLDLPKKSGFELVRMARALNRNARIVVTSAQGEPVNRTRMKKEGAFDFLDKPLRRATLLAAARNALRSTGMTSVSDAAVSTGTDGEPGNSRPA
jgi:two-component system response regulator HydG